MFRTPLLSIRAFRDLWIGQAISMLGDSFYYVVNAFMVKKITGSDAMVGYNGALECLPYLLIGPYAGVVADRLDRRKIMMFSELASFGTLAMLASLILGWATPPVWGILLNGFLLASCRSFFMPARNAAIPSLVRSDQVLAANALNAATQNVMPMIGLSFSAAVLGVIYSISQKYFYLVSVGLNGLSRLGSAFFVWRLPALEPVREEVRDQHPWEDLKDGLRYIKGRRVLRVLFTQNLVLNLMISPFFIAYVACNEAWFGGKPQTLSWFEASFCAGMIVSSMAVGRLNVRKVGWGAIIGNAGVGASVWVMAYTRSLPLFMVWNLVAGLFLPFSLVPSQAYTQSTVPDEFRGRVQSVSSMISMGVQPIGLSLGGLLLKYTGLANSFVVMGAGTMAAVLVGLSSREFRNSRLSENVVSPTGAALEAAGTA